MPQDPMAQMIQLLATISDMQNKRKELTLREQEMAARKEETARGFGIQEKSQQFKAFQDFLTMASDIPTEARGKLAEAAQKAFGQSDEGKSFAQAITALAMSAPESLKLLQARKAAEGAGQVPSGEVASTALTGQTQGGLAVSGMQRALNNPATVTPQMQSANSQFMANRQDPLTAILQATIQSNPDLRNRMANQMSGGMSPYQSAEITLGQRGATTAETNAATSQRNAATSEAQVRQEGIRDEMTTARDLVIAHLAHGSTASQQAANIRLLQNQQKIALNKSMNPAQRKQAMDQYNQMANMFGLPQLRMASPDDGGPATLLDQMQRAISPYEINPGAPQQNPMMPFLPPASVPFSPSPSMFPPGQVRP